MTHILFLCIDRADVAPLARILNPLRAGGATVSFVTGYLRPVEKGDVGHAPVLRPPRTRSGWLLSPTLRGVVGCTRSSENHRFARAWLGSFPAFLRGALQTARPDLVVLTPPDIEPSLAARACEDLGIPYVCFVPPYYELMLDSRLATHEHARACLTAGPFGRERLLSLGVPDERIVVVGSPGFGPVAPLPSLMPETTGLRTILCTSQGLAGNPRLFERLCRYVASREGVRLVWRPHPGAREDAALYRDIRSRVAAGHAVEVAPPGSLAEQLSQAAALVTISSTTVLQALRQHVPVVLWSADGLPARVPFGIEGAARIAQDYGELSSALDAMLFDEEYRARWLESHERACDRYVAPGNAEERFVEALLERASPSRA